MKAMVCRELTGPDALELAEIDDPVATAGQVIIDVKACAVTFPDLLMTRDLYQYKPTPPFTPGGEVAGVVRSLGEGVTDLSVGDRVIASALTGGLAEQVAVTATSALVIPAQVEFAEAAGLMYAYGTSHHALRDRANLQPGETLLVLGAAGGVGLSAVELGRLMGARVIAAASNDEKLELCRRHGADETINYATEDLKTRVRELTGGAGVDVVYDPVGGPYSEPALRATAWRGRFLVVGFAAGEIPRLPMNLPLLRGCSVVGVFWGAFVGREPEANRRNVAELVSWWADGSLQPHVSATYPLAQAADALRDLDQRRALGKVVVIIG